MLLSIRAVFAVSLWLLALVPPALYLVHLSSPVAAVQVVEGAEAALRWALLGGFGVLAVMLLLYPPFLPGLRLGFRRLKGRVSTDMGPLREAQGRLQHLETAADHLIVGRALQTQGKMLESVHHLGRAVELDPTHSASRYQLGVALARAGNLQVAADQLAQVVENDPAHAFGAAMLEFGVVLERGSADQQAVAVFERYEQQFGDNRRSAYHRARSLSRLGRRDEAIAALEQAARPPEHGTLGPEDELLRARARVGLMRGGRL